MADSFADRRARQEARRDRRSAVTDPDVVMAAGAALLAIRSRTTQELRQRLVVLGYPTDLVDQTVDRLLVLGYLDDEGYARAWIAGRDRSRPRGASALRRELQRKGLARELVDAALHERDDALTADRVEPASEPMIGEPASADLDAARRLLDRRRVALARGADPRRTRQRAYALLARNGFDPDVCRRALIAFGADPLETDDDTEGGPIDG
jgi:regulatory protein